MIRFLDRYSKEGVLFTFLDPDLDVSAPLASTTTPLEGGINSPLKAFLSAHRGWSENRMLTAIDYWLYHRSIDPQPLETFINNTATTKAPRQEPQPGPTQIDNTINQNQPWEDGLTIRQGWIRN
ncbi:hypothetical protein [Trueperella pyogenes]|uniref:hypothetical protein n=1 Tax=Trueperella pyogenes TaxID=1661 RepID=UPI0031334D06